MICLCMKVYNSLLFFPWQIQCNIYGRKLMAMADTMMVGILGLDPGAVPGISSGGASANSGGLEA